MNVVPLNPPKGKPGVYARMANYVDWIHNTIKRKAVTTDQKCREPLDMFNVMDNAILDCSYESCDVHCKDPTYVPNVNQELYKI